MALSPVALVPVLSLLGFHVTLFALYLVFIEIPFAVFYRLGLPVGRRGDWFGYAFPNWLGWTLIALTDIVVLYLLGCAALRRLDARAAATGGAVLGARTSTRRAEPPSPAGRCYTTAARRPDAPETSRAAARALTHVDAPHFLDALKVEHTVVALPFAYLGMVPAGRVPATERVASPRQGASPCPFW